MDELHRLTGLTDKFEIETHKLLQAVERIDPESPEYYNAVMISLHQAKRVRKESNLLVREIARIRDELQPEEA